MNGWKLVATVLGVAAYVIAIVLLLSSCGMENFGDPIIDDDPHPILEFTPKSNPDYICVIATNRFGLAVAMQCIPKGPTT